MNVYDFDNTIYDGESAVDFFFFCLKRDITLLRLLPLVITKLVKYKMCLISHSELEYYIGKYAKSLLDNIDDTDALLRDFWEKHFKKIKPFYIAGKQPDDVLLSATFDFLLEIPAEKLGIKNVICSHFDLKTGTLGQLCYKEKKTVLFAQKFPDAKDVCFFTDSMNDTAMISFSSEAYLVKGNKITKLK